MSRNPKAEVGAAHGLAVIVWLALDADTWPEFCERLATTLKTFADSPRKLRGLIRSFWPLDSSGRQPARRPRG